MRFFQFSIRDLLWIMAFAALLTSWWLDHSKMASTIDELQTPTLIGYTNMTIPRPTAVTIPPVDELFGVGPGLQDSVIISK